jgi:hypothetical protein
VLDLQMISPDEPVEPGYVTVFTDLSDTDRLFQGCFLEWSRRVEADLDMKVMAKSISFKDGVDKKDPVQRCYIGDFYVRCESPLNNLQFAADFFSLQESVQDWRYYALDTVFLLERYSYKNNSRWLHFVLTNKPEYFLKNRK